jgi:hypothetical protein
MSLWLKKNVLVAKENVLVAKENVLVAKENLGKFILQINQILVHFE